MNSQAPIFISELFTTNEKDHYRVIYAFDVFLLVALIFENYTHRTLQCLCAYLFFLTLFDFQDNLFA